MKIEFKANVLGTFPLSVEVPAPYAEAVKLMVERYDELTIRLSPPTKPRTTGERSQSHHLNGHIQTICLETGNDFDAVKTLVKMRAISRGYPFTSIRGLTIPKSEAACTTTECGLLIDEVHQLAAEEGIALVEYEYDRA